MTPCLHLRNEPLTCGPDLRQQRGSQCRKLQRLLGLLLATLLGWRNFSQTWGLSLPFSFGAKGCFYHKVRKVPSAIEKKNAIVINENLSWEDTKWKNTLTLESNFSRFGSEGPAPSSTRGCKSLFLEWKQSKQTVDSKIRIHVKTPESTVDLLLFHLFR